MENKKYVYAFVDEKYGIEKGFKSFDECFEYAEARMNDEKISPYYYRFVNYPNTWRIVTLKGESEIEDTRFYIQRVEVN